MSDLMVDLNVIRVYLRLWLNVLVILMFCFVCCCIKNVYFYNNLSIAKWHWILHQIYDDDDYNDDHHSGDVIYFEKMYIFIYCIITLLHTGIHRNDWITNVRHIQNESYH